MLQKRCLMISNVRNYILFTYIIMLLTFFLTGCSQGKLTSSSTSADDYYKVVRVIDGDTLEIDINGKIEKLRLIGINTPETKHPTKGVEPFGKQAARYSTRKLEGKKIQIEFDVDKRDKYGRLLAYVWLDDEMFNADLIKQGYAQVATYPPNVKYVELFTKLQREARQSNMGLWQQNFKTLGAYIGSVKSNKYHKIDCKYANQISVSNSIYFINKSDAQAKGYQPCGWCRPGGLDV